MVWTVEPTLATGCHFYCYTTMQETMHWRWNNRTLGQSISNTDGTSAELWLHPMLFDIQRQLIWDRPSDLPEEVREEAICSRPSPADVAALVTMTRLPELFASNGNVPTDNASRRTASHLQHDLSTLRRCSLLVVEKLMQALKSDDPAVCELSSLERKRYLEAIDETAAFFLERCKALKA